MGLARIFRSNCDQPHFDCNAYFTQFQLVNQRLKEGFEPLNIESGQSRMLYSFVKEFPVEVSGTRTTRLLQYNLHTTSKWNGIVTELWVEPQR